MFGTSYSHFIYPSYPFIVAVKFAINFDEVWVCDLSGNCFNLCTIIVTHVAIWLCAGHPVKTPMQMCKQKCTDIVC